MSPGTLAACCRCLPPPPVALLLPPVPCQPPLPLPQQRARAGVPAEFNDCLPKDSEEYKRWKASQEAGVSGAMAGLAVGEGGAPGGEGGAAPAAAAEPAQEKKSSKKKKSGKPEASHLPVGAGVRAAAAAVQLLLAPPIHPALNLHPPTLSPAQNTTSPQVVLERNTRNKKKCITTVSGLDAFGVKLGEASKLFGKKFASGASVVKNAEGKEHIDVQVRGQVGGAGGAVLGVEWVGGGVQK